VPSPARQLSTFCANAPDAEATIAAEAKSDATLLSFFMILLSRKAAVSLRLRPNRNREKCRQTQSFHGLTTDGRLCHPVVGRTPFWPSLHDSLPLLLRECYRAQQQLESARPIDDKHASCSGRIASSGTQSL
jgi:hypothetical protein